MNNLIIGWKLIKADPYSFAWISVLLGNAAFLLGHLIGQLINHI